MPRSLSIDWTRRIVTRDGHVVPLEPKVFEVVAALASAAGRVVSKAELLSQVWPGVHVTESSLARAISLARAALGDDARNQSVIRTVAKRGYVLHATIEGEAPTRLVGREAEMARIDASVREAADGTSRQVWICGEAGIGKSALLEHLDACAARRGFHVLKARCREVEGAEAFAPWIQMLDPADARELVAPTNAATELGGGRLRQFHSVSAVLERAARTAPLALVFDDLHRADVPSLRLLQYVVGRLSPLGVLTAAAVRSVGDVPREDQARALAELLREPHATTITLGAFAIDDVRTLAARDHPALTDATLHDVHRRAGGNPFFVTQLLAVAESRCGDELPADLRLAALESILDLPVPTRHALDAAATLGRDVELPLLAAVLRRSATATMRVLAPALGRRIVTADTASGVLRFRHALIRDALYQELALHDRSGLHARAFRVLARERRPDRSAELAAHAANAVDVLGVEPVLDLTVRAARRATAQLAHEEAALHYERAIGLLDRSAVSDPERKGDVLLAHAEAQLRSGARAEALRTLHRAAEIAETAGAATLLARVALTTAPGFLAIEHGGHDRVLLGLIDRALAMLPTSAASWRARLLGRRALALYWTDADAERQHAIAEAMRLARKVGDEALRHEIDLAELLAKWGPDNLDARWARLPALLSHAASMQGAADTCLHRMFWITTALEAGAMPTVHDQVREFAREADALREPQAQWTAVLFQAMLALHGGELEAARTRAAEFHEIGRRSGDANAAQSYVAIMVVIALFANRAVEVLDGLRGAVRAFPNVPSYSAGLAWALAAAGRRTSVRRQIDDALDRVHCDGTRTLAWLPSVAFAAEAATIADLPTQAERLYEMLHPYADRLIVAGFGTATFGSTSYFLGGLARTLGRESEARRWFGRALATNREIGHVPFAARAERALHAPSQPH